MEAIGHVVAQFFTDTASRFVEGEGRVLRTALMRMAYALALVATTALFAALAGALVLFALFVRLSESTTTAVAALLTALAALLVAAGLAFTARELTRSPARATRQGRDD